MLVSNVHPEGKGTLVPEACSGPLTALWSTSQSEIWEIYLVLFLSDLAFDFQYIDTELPPESPYLYGLHPNAEIGFLTQTSEKLFHTVLELQPQDSQAGHGAGAMKEEKVYGGDCLRSLWGAHWSHFLYTAQTILCTPTPLTCLPVQP